MAFDINSPHTHTLRKLGEAAAAMLVYWLKGASGFFGSFRGLFFFVFLSFFAFLDSKSTRAEYKLGESILKFSSQVVLYFTFHFLSSDHTVTLTVVVLVLHQLNSKLVLDKTGECLFLFPISMAILTVFGALDFSLIITHQLSDLVIKAMIFTGCFPLCGRSRHFPLILLPSFSLFYDDCIRVGVSWLFWGFLIFEGWCLWPSSEREGYCLDLAFEGHSPPFLL